KGAVLPWDAGLNSTVWGLTVVDKTLCLGGSFTEGFGGVRSRLVGVPLGSAPTQLPPSGAAIAMSGPWPNPAAEEASIEFTIPVPTRVSVALFDIQGRRVVSIDVPQAVAPGRHALAIPVRGLAKGLYACRLSAGGREVVKKLLVVR